MVRSLEGTSEEGVVLFSLVLSSRSWLQGCLETFLAAVQPLACVLT